MYFEPVLAAWSGLEDVNTLVNTGSDDSVVSEIEKKFPGGGDAQAVPMNNERD